MSCGIEELLFLFINDFILGISVFMEGYIIIGSF